MAKEQALQLKMKSISKAKKQRGLQFKLVYQLFSSKYYSR
jgi:hypothetical protein